MYRKEMKMLWSKGVVNLFGFYFANCTTEEFFVKNSKIIYIVYKCLLYGATLSIIINRFFEIFH